MRYVFYHAACLDGLTSRLVADRFFGRKAVYFGCGHGSQDKPYLNVSENSTIYFLDYAPDKENLFYLLENLSSDITILDHHFSAINAIGKIEHKKLEKILNQKKSGAGLAWDYFFPETSRPLFIDIVEAIDLNKASFFEDEEQFYTVAAYFDQLDLEDFPSFTQRIKEIENLSIADIETLGRPYRKNNQQKIRRDMAQAQQIMLRLGMGDFSAVLINVDIYEHSREFVPYIRNDTGTDAVLLWFELDPDCYRINIHTTEKSANAHNILSYIKEMTQCKGGGHAHSTVARMTKSQFEIFQERVFPARDIKTSSYI